MVSTILRVIDIVPPKNPGKPAWRLYCLVYKVDQFYVCLVCGIHVHHPNRGQCLLEHHPCHWPIDSMYKGSTKVKHAWWLSSLSWLSYSDGGTIFNKGSFNAFCLDGMLFVRFASIDRSHKQPSCCCCYKDQRRNDLHLKRWCGQDNNNNKPCNK